ncbi:MAG: ParB/RepB/Spo0J family partition protein [bacterium]
MHDSKFAEPTKYDSIFWVEVDKISPNPYQPRKEFDEARLKALAESIRQYGVLQPLTVTRKEIEKPEGGLASVYELIAGERRLRASKLIGLKEVPVVIRVGEETDRMKLELAIIENLQREDLNAVDRAKALEQLVEFGLSHSEIGAKIGMSREYVSNTVRLLNLPEHMLQAIVDKEMTEGHARTILMLAGKPDEQETLFKEIVLKKMSVRAAEQVARNIAPDRVKRYHRKTPEMVTIERALTEALGTRVMIESNDKGGRLMIDFFSSEDLSSIVAALAAKDAAAQAPAPLAANTTHVDAMPATPPAPEDDLYSVSNFSV